MGVLTFEDNLFVRGKTEHFMEYAECEKWKK